MEQPPLPSAAGAKKQPSALQKFLASINPFPAWAFDDEAPEGSIRDKCKKFLVGQPFDIGLGCIVFFHMCLVVIETDKVSLLEDVPVVLTLCNRALLFLYSAELSLRCWAFRLRAFAEPFTIIDTGLISVDIITLFSDQSFMNSSVLRVIRCCKIFRTLELLDMAPELHLMMKGLVGAVKSIFWGCLLLCVIVIVWSIFAVVAIHPINVRVAEAGAYDTCSRCPHAYETVFSSSLTIIQTVVLGDSWGTVALPIVEHTPSALLFFLIIYVTVALAGMNLILAVIVDCAQEARKLTLHDAAVKKQEEFEEAKKALVKLCGGLDSDNNGLLSLEELTQGLEDNPEFADILEILEIKQEDMPIIFGVMDMDGSGEVSYHEFVKELYRLQSNDIQSMIVYIRFYVTQIRTQLMSRMESLTKQITDKIAEEEQELAEKMLAEEKALEEKMMAQEAELQKVIVEEESHLENAMHKEEQLMETFISKEIVASPGAGQKATGSPPSGSAKVEAFANVPAEWQDMSRRLDVIASANEVAFTQLNDTMLKLLSTFEGFRLSGGEGTSSSLLVTPGKQRNENSGLQPRCMPLLPEEKCRAQPPTSVWPCRCPSSAATPRIVAIPTDT